MGPEHPNVATSLNNLALIYYDQGKYAEAEPLYQRDLATQKRPWGPSILTWLQASTTWPCSTTTRVSMPRPSPCTNGP